MGKSRKWIALLLIVLFVICTIFPVVALGANTSGSDEVVILFDISTSMSWYDTGFLAPNALQQLVQTLPAHWHVGLVTFDTDVVDVVAPSANSRPIIHAILDDVQYNNWTNSGAGIFQAMELFSENALSRTIVFVTDGEKANMPNNAATIAATELAEDAIALLVASDIIVHSIVIEYAFDIRHEAIMNLSANTGGMLFEGVSSEELSNTAFQLLSDALSVAGTVVGRTQATDQLSNLIISLPAVDRAQVLLKAEAEIENISVSGTGRSVEIINGSRFAVIDILEPNVQEFHLAFSARGISEAALFIEWDIQLMTELHPTEPTLRAWFADDFGVNVLLDPFFIGRTLPVTVDGVTSQVQIDEGYLILGISREEMDTYQLVSVDLSTLGINTLSGATTELVVVTPAKSQNNLLLLFGIIFAFVLLAICLVLLLKKRAKPSGQAVVSNFDSKHSFTGKLNLYVTRTPEDLDIPPQSFDLFRLTTGEISLQDILSKCQLSIGFSGVEKIYFVAGTQGVIQVVNDSDCTVLVGADLLLKKRGRSLEYGEKIHITCEDEISEIEVHYKSVKPSERSVIVTPLIGQAGLK